MMVATHFQDLACLGTLFLFALVSANPQNVPLQDGNSTGAQHLQAELMEAGRQFQQFQKDFQKNYATEEERQWRFELFQNNIKEANELNELEEGTAVYGATIFADWTSDEFSKYYGGRNLTSELEERIPLPMARIPGIHEMPEEFDWRRLNVVNGVKHDLHCGACWAFSVTANIESQYAIKHKELLSFSEQQLVDCVTTNNGCSDGSIGNAIKELKGMGGLQLAKDYPYVGEQQKCKFNKKLVKARVKHWMEVSLNETVMAKNLVEYGPISIVINARAMRAYKGGVSQPPKAMCDPDKVDHTAIIVGFGVLRHPTNQNTIPYWIIRNSWGPQWGEQGYYRLHRGVGACGVNKLAIFAELV